jgi:hypothetical protein
MQPQALYISKIRSAPRHGVDELAAEWPRIRHVRPSGAAFHRQPGVGLCGHIRVIWAGFYWVARQGTGILHSDGQMSSWSRTDARLPEHLNPAQLDGYACVHCGSEDSVLQPNEIWSKSYRQLLECVDRETCEQRARSNPAP